MRYRRTLQTILIVTALILGFIPQHTNGLSILAAMLMLTPLLLQPGVWSRVLAQFRDQPTTVEQVDAKSY